MNTDLQDYLNEKGWAFKIVEGGRQVRVDEECPFCGKRKHFMFSAETTKWDCKRCGETGNLLTLKRRLGDLKLEVRSAASVFYRGLPDRKPDLPGERPPEGTDVKFHRRLMDGGSPETLEYVLSRGFTMETIKHFRLGVAGTRNKLLLSIPHYYKGELVCLKFRTVPPAKKGFTRWRDCPSVLFNGDCLDGLADMPARERVVLICEGETDAMALRQMGYPFVVASTTGAGKSDWPEHWLEPLEPATEILLVYDTDSAGEEGALKAAAALGKFRCKRVVPPLHDCAKMIEAGYGRAEMDAAIAQATAYDESAVRGAGHFADALLAMLMSEKPRGRPTGWVTLDAVLGGIRPGELTIITGDTGSGKSTWGTALARHQAVQGDPVLIAPFEQPCHEILGKLVGMETGRDIFSMKREEVLEAAAWVDKHNIKFLDRLGPTPFGEIKDAIYWAVHRYGVKFVLIDHLHFFLDCKEENERAFIDQTVRALKVITRDLCIHIALVVHPSKLGRSVTGGTRKTVLDDLKGSSEIKKTCDNGIRVWRERENDVGSSNDRTEITVLKCRSPAGKEGTAWFYFDPSGERYLEGSSSPFGAQPYCEDSEPVQEWGLYQEPN